MDLIEELRQKRAAAAYAEQRRLSRRFTAFMLCLVAVTVFVISTVMGVVVGGLGAVITSLTSAAVSAVCGRICRVMYQ